MTEEEAGAIVTAAEAYPPGLACAMWAVFGAAAKEMGYALPKGVAAQECRSMHGVDATL